jgi:hypothetical protein
MKAAGIALLVSLVAASAYGETAVRPAAVPSGSAAQNVQRSEPAQPAPDAAAQNTTPSTPFPATGYSSYVFKELGARQGLRLVEGAGEGGVSYMVRRDEVVTAARLHLMLENSAGFPSDTKLEVTVNGDQVGTVDVGADRHSATPVDLPVDPILLGDYNRIGFKLLGVPLASCRANDAGPWMTVSPRSAVDIAADHLPLANDLAILPLPFFDARDPHAVQTSFVFTRTPSLVELESAGVVASWLGGLAGYRGVHLPVRFGSLPQGDAILFVTAHDSLQGLSLPTIDGPSLAMVPNPTDPSGKLLLVMGRDVGELKIAARGLAVGGRDLKNGAVSPVSAPAADVRGAYDAPGWIPDSRPVKFSALATEDQLRSHGIRPEPISIDFRSAPDYFNWVDSEIPMKLRFSVTPEPTVDLARSRLDITLNDTPFKSLPLAESPSFLDSDRARHEGTVDIPPFLLTGRNRLNLYFDMVPSPQCDAAGAATLVERIDPNSTIDLSQSPHYAPMPNLSFFANAGFPFTRHADLSQSAVVMPEPTTREDVEAFLEAMALFGEATGYPTLQASVVHASDVNSVSDRDLLLIGSVTSQPLLGAWTSRTGITIENGQLHALPRSLWDRAQLLFDWRNQRNHASDVNDWVQAAPGGEGAIIAFRSPLDDNRSVVAITGTSPEQVAKVAGVLQASESVPKIQDDVVLMRAGDIETFRMARRYDVGSLARWTWLRWNLSDQPIVIAILLFAACAAMAAVAFVILGVKARRRLQGANR